MLAALGFGVAVGYLWPGPAPDGPLAAVVLEVRRPDRVTALLRIDEREDRPVTIHLRGIAPPADPATARLATRLLAAALVDQPVVLTAVRWDWWGDALEARVFLHGTHDIAATLVRQGLAEEKPDG